MAGNANFDTLLSTTLDNYRKQLTDNVFHSRPLLYWLTEKNRTRMLSGGIKIVEPLIYAEGEMGSYGEWDAISITPQDGISAAEFPWRQLYATIAISGLEEAQNNGEEAIINLLEAKVMQAEETLKANLNVMLFGDGTGNSGKEMLGLEALIGDNTTSVTTVGGIDCTAVGNEWWRSNVVDKTDEAVTGTDLLSWLTNAYNTCSKGNDTPDSLMSSQDVYEAYEAALTPQVRYNDVKSANAGFTNLMFKGAPMFWDFDCPVGTVYGLNSKYLTMVGHKDRWFKQSKFSEGLSAANGGTATTVDARYAIITTYGNLTIRNRSRHFKISGIGQTSV